MKDARPFYYAYPEDADKDAGLKGGFVVVVETNVGRGQVWDPGLRDYTEEDIMDLVFEAEQRIMPYPPSYDFSRSFSEDWPD